MRESAQVPTGWWGLALSILCVLTSGRAHASCDSKLLQKNWRKSPALFENEAATLIYHSVGRDFFRPPHGIETRVSSYSYIGPRGYSDMSAVFIRDYYPFVIHEKGGSIMLSYPSYRTLAVGGRMHDGDSTHIPVFRPEGVGENWHAYKVKDKYEWREVRALPLLIEGGNVLPAGKFILTGQKTVDENSQTIEGIASRIRVLRNPQVEQAFLTGLREVGYRKRSADEVALELARGFGVKPEQVMVLPWLPGSRIGHIDLWIGQLGRKAIAIPRVPEFAIARLGYPHERDFALGVNQWLDERAAELSARGLTVERLPMLPPRNLKPSSMSALGWDADFLTPVNWATSGNRIVVPEFTGPVPEEFRGEISRTLARHGFVAEFQNADALIGTSGVFHCLTANSPE